MTAGRVGPPAAPRARRGLAAQVRGIDAEAVAARALEGEGWSILGRRMRTPAGEVDLIARRGPLVAFVEVKARPTLTEAAFALSPRQRRRLVEAAGILLAGQPDWGAGDVRFDVMVVDGQGRVRRIADAFRAE